MLSTARLRHAVLSVAVAAVVAAAMGPASPTGAAPKPSGTRVQLTGTLLSGTSQTTRYADPAEGQVLFDQQVQLVVQGRLGNKPLAGTLTYQVRVLLPGSGAPAQFLDATTQSASFTSDQGNLSSDTSWYAIPVIGFECLSADPVACMEDNAVVLAFGAGTDGFANLRNNALWTLRVAHQSASGVVTAASLTGGVGLGFKYCHEGQATTVASPALGDYRTTTSLVMTSAACIDENGDLIPKETVPGGALSLEYGVNWSVSLVNPDEPVVTLYPDRSAHVWSSAGDLTGVVGEVHMGSYPPTATGEALYLGAPWGGALTGLYAGYKYALVRTWNVEQSFDGEFPIGTRTVDPTSSTMGILAVY